VANGSYKHGHHFKEYQVGHTGFFPQLLTTIVCAKIETQQPYPGML